MQMSSVPDHLLGVELGASPSSRVLRLTVLPSLSQFGSKWCRSHTTGPNSPSLLHVVSAGAKSSKPGTYIPTSCSCRILMPFDFVLGIQHPSSRNETATHIHHQTQSSNTITKPSLSSPVPQPSSLLKPDHSDQTLGPPFLPGPQTQPTPSDNPSSNAQTILRQPCLGPDAIFYQVVCLPPPPPPPPPCEPRPAAAPHHNLAPVVD